MKDKHNKYLKIINFLYFTIVKIYNPAEFNYKRFKINILGMKFTYKTKALKEKVNAHNIELNKKNLDLKLPSKKRKHILFVVFDLDTAGGVETRILHYSRKLIEAGWNVSILSEKNNNKKLLDFTNFYLNFCAQNINDCLNELIDKHDINIVEFQFKNAKILKNIDIEQLKKKVKVGCVCHNLRIENKKIINNFDYKIMVSKYMYDNFYKKDIKNADIINNSFDTNSLKNLPLWEYKNQKTALLISRISYDKLKSIECFIKYCQKNNIDFKIAGEEKPSDKLKNKLTKKYNLQKETFIGQIDTVEYLSDNINNILFTAGLGLVILESLFIGYPSFCCSDYSGKNYSFITADNVMLFDNFTIRKHSPVSKLNKKVYNLDISKISDYCLRDYIFQHRDMNNNFEKYLDIIEFNESIGC